MSGCMEECPDGGGQPERNPRGHRRPADERGVPVHQGVAEGELPQVHDALQGNQGPGGWIQKGLGLDQPFNVRVF